MDNAKAWIAIARIEQGIDIDRLSSLLTEQGVEHRFEQLEGAKVLTIREETKRFVAQAIVRNIIYTGSAADQSATALPTWSQIVEQCPVVLGCLILSITGALLVAFKFEWVHWLTFTGYQVQGDRVFFIPLEHALQQREYWRLLTPALLHFSVFHVVFNCLWLWEFGRRIEKLGGSLHLLNVVLITALIANVSQYLFEGPSLFGGMSGVVYGLLGYIWLRNRIAPHPLLAIAPGLIALMVGWLLLCMTGFVDLLITGGVANGAHVGGLLAGVLLGIFYGKTRTNKSVL